MDIDAINTFLQREFPIVARQLSIEQLDGSFAKTRWKVSDNNLRPGGTIAGPTMFGLADATIYVILLASLEGQKLAVTVNSSIDFMRRPKPADLIAEGRLLKLGRRLAVGDVLMFSDGDDRPVARAGMTYALAPKLENNG